MKTKVYILIKNKLEPCYVLTGKELEAYERGFGINYEVTKPKRWSDLRNPIYKEINRQNKLRRDDQS